MERQFETKTAADNLFLGEQAERGDDPHAEIERFAGCSAEVAEKPGRCIRKWIVTQRPDGDGIDLVEGTEYGCLGKQHQVTAGKADSFVGSFRAGHAPAGRAPVLPVDVLRWQLEDRQWFMTNAGRPQIPAEGTNLGDFPGEALMDEDRINLGVLARQRGEHHAAVEAATDQGANGALHLP